MDRFTPSRLALARERRGLTKTALADLCGLSIRSITAYESGHQAPTPENLLRLATALRFPTTFFERNSIEPLPVSNASFRALSRMTASKRNQALAAGRIALELAAWIEERFSLPTVHVPQYEDVDSETAAETVREVWALGAKPVTNMVHLLEAHGVRVFSLAEDTRDVDAFSFWLDDQPYVFLNTMKSSERSRMDAAHELGHLVLHARQKGPTGRQAEQEAQAFGSAFLMPRSMVIAHAPRNPRLEELVQAKHRWKVAISNLAYRMHAVGVLSEWQYRSLFKEMSRRGYRSSEPEPMAREASQIFTKVFQALRTEGVSATHVAHDLSIPTDELGKLIFGLVPTLVKGGGQAQRSTRPDLRVL